MSGHEYNPGDGSFLLDSELLGHADGRLSAGDVSHRLRFTNNQVCELRVDWTATPEKPLLSYEGETRWQHDLVIHGGSRPRRKRRDERSRSLTVEALPPDSPVPQQRKLPVTTTLNVLDGQGTPTGAVDTRWTVLHELQLS